VPAIQDLHAHVYYDAATLDRARRVCEALRDTFTIPMGRMHEKPVGPHPRWSCQLTIPNEKFADVVS
jgi:DOPA 4,5-dioxygenase